MKTNNISKIIFGLFTSLFISTNIHAQTTLSNFTRYEQELSNTCWAANVRMVANYYGVSKPEAEIVRLAFDVSDTMDLTNATNDIASMSTLLARLLISIHNSWINQPLIESDIATIINNRRPIIAGARLYVDDVPTNIAHMFVVAGYERIGATMRLTTADPTNNRDWRYYNYNEFTNPRLIPGGKYIWETSIYQTTSPPAPKQTIVGKVSAPIKTIMEAVTSAVPNEIIHVWDTVAYGEQVTINSSKSGIYIVSTTWRPNPVIESTNALRVLGAPGINLLGINVNGDNAVYNTGALTLRSLDVSAASGFAIYNAGEFYIDHLNGDSITTVTAASGVAIYNTGAGIVGIYDGNVSTTSNNAAIYNESGSLICLGETELKTGSGDSGNVIYNKDINGTLLLGGNPTITGRLAGFGTGKMAVYTSGVHVFNPGNNKYVLDPANLRNGDIVVVGGAKFINNFKLTDTVFVLAAIGNDLAAISTLEPSFVGKVGALYNTIKAALSPSKSGQVITIIDRETYEEQVTVGGNLSGITLQSSNPTFITKPRIRYVPGSQNVGPQNYAGFSMLSDAHVIDAGVIEENSALRVFGAQGTLIDGVDIEGESAVYNIGDGELTIRNSVVSATSDCAIYNTGLIEIVNVAVLAASDSGYAIYNDDGDGELVLGGSVDITGHIAGFGAGKVSVATNGENFFNPDGKKYILEWNDFRNGDIVVVGGADFINNFELTDSNVVLTVSGNNIVANRTHCTVTFDLGGGTGEEIPGVIRLPVNSVLGEAQTPQASGFARTGYINDGKWYALSDSGYSEFAFGEDGEPLTGNITLYLRWTADEVSVMDANPARVIPPVDVSQETLVTPAVNITPDGFSVGPNPVGRSSGGIAFFWQGKRINGTLSIYDAAGNVVKKIAIKDDAINNQARRKVGSWDLTDKKGRQTPEGTYLVKGKVSISGGKSEKVSLTLGVK